ncbi:MAG: tape measure protein [Paludibacteraceae bacterium]|nr:tape measure protein [Paludibacteraceae bacterium]
MAQGLHFEITGDHDGLDKALKESRQGLKDTAKTAEEQSNGIESSIKKIGVAAGVTFGVAQVKSFVQEVINVRGEFQKLDIAFETMIGNKAESDKLMAQVIDTAAKTPFDLQGVANGAKQLLAYGLEADQVNGTLIRLGDIAAGLGVDLGRLTYLYGTTMTQGRLYTQDLNQFTGAGIPMIKELALQFGVAEKDVKGLVEAGKVGFPEVQKVIEKLTSEGGKFYNLMEKQSASLSGQVANLEDSFSQMLNNIGAQTEGVLYKGIEIASSLVENYEQVGKAIGGLIVAYGSYKAALMSISAINKSMATVKHTEEAKSLFDLLAAEQKEQVSKLGLEVTSKEYYQTVKKEIEINLKASSITLEKARAEVVASSQTLSAKRAEYVSAKELEIQKKAELVTVRATGNAKKIANVESQLSAASSKREAAAIQFQSASRDFNAKKTAVETAAKRNNTLQTNVNTASQNANASATNILSVAKTKLVTALNKAKAAALANPWMLLAAAVAVVAYGIYKLVTRETEYERAQRKVNDAIQEHKDKLEQDKQESQKYLGIINDTTLSLAAQTKAWTDLQKVSEAFKGYSPAELQKMTPAEQAKILADYQSKSEKQNNTSLQKQYEDDIKRIQGNIEAVKAGGNNQGSAAALIALNKELEVAKLGLKNITDVIREQDNAEKLANMTSEQRIAHWQKEIDKNKEIINDAILTGKTYDKVTAKIDEYQKLIASEKRADTESNVHNKEHYETKKKDAELKLAKMDISQKGSTEWNEQEKIIKDAETALKAWGDKTENAFAKAYKESLQKASDAAIEVEKKRTKDKKKLIDIDLKQTIDGIERERKEYKKEYGSKADTSAFDRRITSAKLKAEIDYDDVDKEFEKFYKELEKSNKQLQFDLDISALNDELEAATGVTEQLKIQDTIREKMKNREMEKIGEEEKEDLKKVREEGGDVQKVTDHYQEKREKTEAKFKKEDIGEEITERTKSYKEYAERVIEIEKWKKEQIKAINSNDDFTASQKEERVKQTEQIAEFNTQDAATTILGADAEIIETELNGIVADVEGQSLTTIMANIETLRGEIKKLKKEGGDPAKVAKAEAALAASLNKVNEAQNDVGDSSKKTGDKMELSYKGATNTLKNVVTVCNDISSSFGDMLSDAGSDALSTITNVAGMTISMITSIQSISGAAAASMSAVEKASVILTIISAAIAVVMAIVNVMSKYFSKSAQIQEQIEKSKKRIEELKVTYEELERSMKKAIGTEYYQKQIELVKNLNQQVKIYDQAILDAQEKVDESGTDKKKEKAQEQLDDLEKERNEAIDKADDNIDSFYKELISTDLKSYSESLAESIVEGFSDGVSDLGAVWDEAFDEMMKGMIQKQISMQLERNLSRVFDTVKSAFGDGDQTLSQSEIDAIKSQYEAAEALSESQMNEYKRLMEELGLTDTAEQSAEKKGFAAMSQDTGDELNGRFTAIQISTASIDTNVIDIRRINAEMLERVKEGAYHIDVISGIAENQLIELRAISANTAALKETNLRLKKIEDNTNKL